MLSYSRSARLPVPVKTRPAAAGGGWLGKIFLPKPSPRQIKEQEALEAALKVGFLCFVAVPESLGRPNGRSSQRVAARKRAEFYYCRFHLLHLMSV